MAWTTISDATLEVGKALRALTMRNLRDNITAVANGDAGAPQIQTAAIAAGAVTNAKFTDNTIAMTRLQYPTAADGYVMRNLWGTRNANSTPDITSYSDWTDPVVNPIRCDALTYGTVRLRFDHFGGGSVSHAAARVVVEGTVVAEWVQVLGGATVARVVDFSIVPGYRIVVQTRKDPAYPTSGASGVSNVRLWSGVLSLGAA